MMRTILTIALLGALALPATAQPRPREGAALAQARANERMARERQPQRRLAAEQTDRTTRTVRIGAGGELDVANVAGDIVITRGSGNDATIEITKIARGASDADARELLKLVLVEVTERNNRAEVKTRYPHGEEMRNRRPFSVTVELNISVPQGTRVRAQSVSGSVSARDITGELSVESVSGTVRVANGGRVTSAKSISGTVEVSDTETDSALQTSSVSGNVVLRRVKAPQLTVGAVSGNLLLDDVTCPRVKAQTVSGTVRFNGPLPQNARYELRSHSGSVHVGISGSTGFELDATSFSGSVRSDFPLTARQGAEAAGNRRQRALRGMHGDGSAVLSLTTFSGSIVVTQR